MDRKDFNKCVANQWNWKEIAFQYNTGKAYQHKQDLNALFGNAYRYYEMKLEPYFEEFQEIPRNFLDDLIFEFRKSFPKSERVKGINYFDDLMELFVDKYSDSIHYIPSLGDTSLKSLFKMSDKYDEVINLMIKENKILKTSNGLQWHGYKRNSKYEAVAFLEVLNAKGLLNKKIESDKYKIEILSSTFLDYECTTRTAGKRNEIINSKEEYFALLSSIKEKPSKPSAFSF